MVLSAVMLLMSRVGMVPPPFLHPPVTWVEAFGGVRNLLGCLPFTLPPPPEHPPWLSDPPPTPVPSAPPSVPDPPMDGEGDEEPVVVNPLEG